MARDKRVLIVTKDYLVEQIAKRPAYTIGRALLAIHNRQTATEQGSKKTRLKNGIGFSSNDAWRGSTAAEYYKAHGTLPDNYIAYWLKKMPDGYPRVCKYARQLDDIVRAREIVTTIAKELKIDYLTESIKPCPQDTHTTQNWQR